MRFVRYLQHWLGGTGARLQVTDFVPVIHPIRQWADTFPWAALVSAIEQSFDTRFPKKSPRGRQPVPIRVLLALELLKHALGASDEDICHRLRTDFAVMYACGLREYQVNPSQAHFVLPETLCEFRGRMDEALMDELIAINLPLLWKRGWSVQRILSSIPFRANKAANASRMLPPCIRRKKNARAHRPHRTAALPPDHAAPSPSPRAAARPHKGDAWLWPPLSRPRSRLRDAGASNRTTAPDAG